MSIVVNKDIKIEGSGIKLENIGKYSTNETKVGISIDGKPIYRKEIEITTITMGSQQTYTHNLKIDKCIRADMFAYRASTGTCIKFPYNGSINGAYNVTYFLGLNDLSTNSFNYYIGNGWSSLNKLYIILEYTKTTD